MIIGITKFSSIIFLIFLIHQIPPHNCEVMFLWAWLYSFKEDKKIRLFLSLIQSLQGW